MNNLKQMSEGLISEIGEMKAGIAALKTGNSKIEETLKELKQVQDVLQESATIIEASTADIKKITEDILAKNSDVEDQIRIGFQNALTADDLLPVCKNLPDCFFNTDDAEGKAISVAV